MAIDIFEEMERRWAAPIVARAEVARFTGGGVSPKTMANEDSLGTGPAEKFFIGRRVCYHVPSFIAWLKSRSKKSSRLERRKRTEP